MTENPTAKCGHSTDRCPVCGRPAATASRPFCSKRCADVDLGRWLGGVYRVETEETAEPSEKESS